MKYTFTIEGDPYEDATELKIYTHAMDLHRANEKARQEIRSIFKYGLNEETYTRDEVEAMLEVIRAILNVEGLDQ